MSISAQNARDVERLHRGRFDSTVKDLPKLKGNTRAPRSDSKVAAWLDSTFSKSTKANSVGLGDSSKEGSVYPAYFYQHPENLFSPLKQDRATPYVARAFHMT